MQSSFRNRAGLVLATLTLVCGLVRADEPKKKDDTQSVAFKSGGKELLKLLVPAAATVEDKKGMLSITQNKIEEVELWLAKDAKSLEDAVGKLDKIIDDEFRKLKVKEKKQLKVAGENAVRLLGDGEEADDGDPGHADIVIFKVGSHVFVACTHGETLKAGAQDMLLKMLESAKAP